MSFRNSLFVLCVVCFSVSVSAARAGDETPNPTEPLQTPPGTDRGAWLLQGWARTISGTSGQGTTSLIVNADPDDTITLTAMGQKVVQTHPADFPLANEDQTVSVVVEDPRGATWEGTVVVPNGMRMTLNLKADFLHRGYLGTIKFVAKGCKALPWARRDLRFDVTQDGAPVTPFIVLERGKSAPGVRLKVGTYAVLVSERLGRDWREADSVKLEVKDEDWRFEYGCAK